MLALFSLVAQEAGSGRLFRDARSALGDFISSWERQGLLWCRIAH